MLLILAASCNQKEVLPEEPQPQPQTQITEEQQPAATVYYIEAKGGETKSSISGTDGSFTWSASDQIAVYAGGYKLSDGLESGGAASATFAFTGDNIVDDASRADFAIFPASLVFDGSSVRTGSATNHSAAGLTVTLPASYTLADVQDEKVPVPMIAANAPGGSLAFKNICALLRVTVNNVPKDTRRIEFDFGGKKVQGEFTLTSVTAGTTATVTSDTDGSDDIITVLTPGFDTFGDLTINLPVPTGVADSQEYTNVVITSYDAASGGHKINSITTAVKSGTTWAPGRTSARKLTAYLPVFTVANDKKVVFAPGNLQAVLSGSMVGSVMSSNHYFWGAKSWQFAPYQYTVIGNTAENKLEDPAENQVIDLFSWIGSSKGYEDDRRFGIFVFVSGSGTTGGTGNAMEDALLADWGVNVIGTYLTNTWRTPTCADWSYVLTSSERSKTRFTKIVLTLTDEPLTTINGLVIFPDQYSHPLGTEFTNNNRTGVAFDAGGSISLADWSLLEAAGCVFLPSAGIRTYSDGRVVSDNEKAVYWTPDASTSSVNQAMALYGTNSGLQTSGYSRARYYGCAVRLVHDVN